jgi:hypothetical protein
MPRMPVAVLPPKMRISGGGLVVVVVVVPGRGSWRAW